MLEEQMQELRELPARVAGVELQILQLREEMQVGFSATRSELRDEIRAGDQATRDFMRMLYEEHKTTLKTIGEGTKRRKR